MANLNSAVFVDVVETLRREQKEQRDKIAALQGELKAMKEEHKRQLDEIEERENKHSRDIMTMLTVQLVGTAVFLAFMLVYWVCR